MRKIVFIGMLICLVTGLCLAQEKPAKIVTAIEIRGNRSISTNTIISKLKTRIGSYYQENIITEDLKRLYLLGFFSDIKIDTEDYKDGLKIILTVVERPLIERISLSGIKRLNITQEKIKESLKSKENQYLDYPNLNDDVITLKKMYEKIGYSQVRIDYKVDIDEKTNKAKVEFIIDEGKRITIKNILIEGNANFSDRKLSRLLKTKRAWLFNAGVLKEEVLKEDIERIKSFYQRNGFADVEVNYILKTDPKRPSLIYININIKEGKKYLVGDISIKGNQNISQKDILARLSECLPGKVFSQEALKQDIANIQGLYFDHGYIFVQLQETTSLNPTTERIDIAYNIIENEVAYVERIKIRGNIKTKDLVIRRELRLKPGDRFDGEKLRRSKERLQNLGFFEEISYDIEDTPVKNKKDLVVNVKEARTGVFSIGGGYSTVDEFVGFIEIEQKNFDWKNFPYFTGGGQDLKLHASSGTVSSGFELSFTEPWLFDYPILFGFDGYRRRHERESDVGYGYNEEITGGDLRLGKELSEYVRLDLMYRFDVIKISNITEEATSDLKKEEGKNNISSIETSLTYDSRDNVFDPKKGNLIRTSIEVAGGPIGADKDFYKFFLRYSHYFPIFTKSALEFRTRIGLADAYGGSDSLPIYERFFAGGSYTIRGYEERAIGPIDSVSEDPLGGNSMFIGNLEYTYALFDFLKLAVFADTGNVWNKLDDFGSGGLKSSFGFGFRLKTPIGPIMLDYGIPLNKAPGEEDKSRGRFHFSMSHGF
ncbi:MAG: outer membrane protein assembly factor BamA [Candidatus Omnitrophica bacterium]|nr:outer membrane protein assembly factor BamA [Candidatus Omnitrophota bacterium]